MGENATATKDVPVEVENVPVDLENVIATKDVPVEVENVPVDLENATRDNAELPDSLRAELSTIEEAEIVKVNGVNDEMPPPFLLFDKKCGETFLDADLLHLKIGQLPKMVAEGHEYVEYEHPYTELYGDEVEALKPQPQLVAFVGKWYKLFLLILAIAVLVVVGVLERKAIQFTV